MGKGGANPYPGWWATSDKPVIKERPRQPNYPYNIETPEERRKRELDEYYAEKGWSQRERERKAQFKKDFMEGKYFTFGEPIKEPSPHFPNPQCNDIDPIFKIKKSSSYDDFKKSYKKLILKHHPDKGGDSTMFIKIQKAWEDIKLYFA